MEKKNKFDFQTYNNEYKKKNYRRFTIMIPYEKKDTIEKLESIKNKNSYIVSLIEQDLKNEKIIERWEKDKKNR